MNRFEVRQLIVARIHTETEEKTRVSSVDNLVITELLKRLSDRRYVRCVSHVLTSTKFDWYF